MEIRSVLAACAVVVACLQGAGGQQVPPLAPPPPSDEPLLGQGEWSESPCVHSVYLARIAELEAELAMYRTASTAGQVVCTLGGEHARLDGGANGTYTITTNTTDAPCETATAVLNLHVTETAEIELPGLLVRITDVFNKTYNDTDMIDEDELWDPGTLMVQIPGLGNIGMDIWSPFFGTLLAMSACCVFVLVVAVLEKAFMCIGGDAIHKMVDEQKLINEELHKLLSVVGPVLDKVEEVEGAPEDRTDPSSPRKKKGLVSLVTNDGKPMTATDFLHTITHVMSELATPERIEEAEKRAEMTATKLGGAKAGSAVKAGEKAYEASQKGGKKGGKKGGNKKDNLGKNQVANPLFSADADDDDDDGK